MAKWIYEVPTGKWMMRFRNAGIFNTDPVNYHSVETGTVTPDPITERFDPVLISRPATPTEITESKQDRSAFDAGQRFDTDLALQASILASEFPGGQVPNATQIAQARARFIVIYSALNVGN